MSNFSLKPLAVASVGVGLGLLSVASVSSAQTANPQFLTYNANGVVAQQASARGAKRAQRQAQMQALETFIRTNLGLSAQQTALFNNVVAARNAAMAQMDGVRQSGQRPERSAVKAARGPAREARKAFRQSLTEAQKQTLKAYMQEKGFERGRRGGKRRQNRFN